MEFDDHYAPMGYGTLKNYPIYASMLKDLLWRWKDAGDDRECKEGVITEALTQLPGTVSNMVVREWKTEVSEDERRSIVSSVLAELVFKESQGFFQKHAGYATYSEYLRIGHIPGAVGQTALDELREATYEPGAPSEITFEWDETPWPRQWLIPQWLPAGRAAILSGEAGWGKSRLVLQLAAAVAAGDPEWLEGGPVTTKPESGVALLQGRSEPPMVVFATWGDEPDDVASYLRRMGDRAAEVGDRLHLLDFAGKGSLWQTPERPEVVDPRVVAEPGSGEFAYGGPVGDGSRRTNTLATAGRWLRVYCQQYSPALLVIDPIEEAFACKEKDHSLLRNFTASWDVWARAADCTVLFVSRASKSGTAHSPSTDWQAACRTVWTLDLESIPKPKIGEMKDTGDQPDKAPRLACNDSSSVVQAKPLWLEADDGGLWRVCSANASCAETGT